MLFTWLFNLHLPHNKIFFYNWPKCQTQIDSAISLSIDLLLIFTDVASSLFYNAISNPCWIKIFITSRRHMLRLSIPPNLSTSNLALKTMVLIPFCHRFCKGFTCYLPIIKSTNQSTKYLKQADTKCLGNKP